MDVRAALAEVINTNLDCMKSARDLLWIKKEDEASLLRLFFRNASCCGACSIELPTAALEG